VNSIAVANGADIIRVHDVREGRHAADAVGNSGQMVIDVGKILSLEDGVSVLRRAEVGEVETSLRKVSFVQDVVIDGSGFEQAGSVFLDVDITTQIERKCSRCLLPVQESIELHETFEVANDGAVEEIDVLPRILSFIGSSLSPRPLCLTGLPGSMPVLWDQS